MALSHFSHLYRSISVQRQVLMRCQPLVYGSVRCCSDEGKKDMVAIPKQQQQQDKGGTDYGRVGRLGLTDHRINKFERYLLVWSGKYKTLAEVPNLVNQDVLERARNKARIKINLMMCAATLLACLAMVYSGKKARAAGESVVKINQDWHKQVNEEYRISKEKQSE